MLKRIMSQYRFLTFIAINSITKINMTATEMVIAVRTLFFQLYNFLVLFEAVSLSLCSEETEKIRVVSTIGEIIMDIGNKK